MREEMTGFWDAVASAEPYANNLHLAPDIPTPHHSIFTGRVLFQTPNQQSQSNEGKSTHLNYKSTSNQIHLSSQRPINNFLPLFMIGYFAMCFYG